MQNKVPTFVQAEVLRYMGAFLERNDQLPTMEAIAEHFNWKSSNTANCCLRSLSRKGLIERNELHKWRFTATGRAISKTTSGVTIDTAINQ